jgi:hypothetical protein
MDYIHQERDAHDRRAVRLKLSAKGLALCDRIRELQDHLTADLEKSGMTLPAMGMAIDALQGVERTWTNYIRYGRR